MRVIALVDAQNRGKTTSIKIAKEEFLKDPEVDNPHELTGFYQPVGKDIRAVVELINGYRIAFCSGGDDSFFVDDNYQYAICHKCDLLVTASRGPSKNGSWTKLTEIMHNTPGNDGLLVKAIDFWPDSPKFLDKDDDYRRISELTAKHLVNIIKYAMKRP